MIDSTYEKLRLRLRRLHGRNELLAKAIGLKGKPHVFDTTAGLGRDALLLSALGLKVTMFERNPTVQNALEQTLQRLSKDEEFAPLIERMSLNKVCAIEYLLKNDCAPDVIYCDPMFEPKSKKALSKKAMEELKSLVGHDDDVELLIEVALKRAQKRVVVKRANYSESWPKNPSIVFKGRSHRFDIYLLAPKADE